MSAVCPNCGMAVGAIRGIIPQFKCGSSSFVLNGQRVLQKTEVCAEIAALRAQLAERDKRVEELEEGICDALHAYDNEKGDILRKALGGAGGEVCANICV